jgi:hypothetical protein
VRATIGARRIAVGDARIGHDALMNGRRPAAALCALVLSLAFASVTGLRSVQPRDNALAEALQEAGLDCGSAVHPRHPEVAQVDLDDVVECPDARQGQMFLLLAELVNGLLVGLILTRWRSRVLVLPVAVLALAAVVVAVGQNPGAVEVVLHGLISVVLVLWAATRGVVVGDRA